jgi:biopolymer transport protein ExbD
MAMSVGGEGGDEAPMSDINTTPLVDVMLVLLIIFLITIPVAIKSVKVKTPNLAYQPTVSKAENVVLTVRGEEDGSCGVYWGLTRVHTSELADMASAKFKNEADKLSVRDAKDPNKFPEVHIRGDRNTPYRCIGGTVAIMQRSGFFRVGFISEPKLAG